ncbi:MAG: hypothetical protein LBQ84_01275, partial [Flavobacteriaceae bacterium]|nr:hypothetical protein [Flavobacteriaceae bacterium]
ILNNFNNVSTKLIKLSFFNSDFVLYVLKLICSYGLFNLKQIPKKLVSDIKFASKNEEIIASQNILTNVKFT